MMLELPPDGLIVGEASVAVVILAVCLGTGRLAQSSERIR
jgi:hypothetical protein